MSMTAPAIKVLMVEDNPADALLFRTALESDRLDTFLVTSVERLSESLGLLELEPFDIILLDLGLPDSQGLATFERCHRFAPDLPIIVFSGNTDEQAAVEAVRAGAQDYLVKGQAAWDIVARTIRYAIERQHSQLTLRTISRRQEAILAAVPDIIMEVNQRMVYVWANQAGFEFFGKNVIGKEAFYYFEPGQNAYEMLRPLIEGVENTIYLEARQVRQDGQTRLLAWHCRVLKNAEGEVTGALSTAHDITERKQAEEELRASEERYRNLVENMNDIVMEVDAQGNYCYLSPSYSRLSGYSLEDELGSSALQHVHPDDQMFVVQKMIEALSVEQQGLIYRVQNKNMEWRWLETSGKPFQAADGKQHLICVSRDITERKQTEEALRESETRLGTIFRASPLPIVISRLKGGKYVDANIAFEKLTGFSRDEIVGHTAEELNNWTDLERRKQMIDELRAKGSIHNFEFQIRHRFGECHDLLMSAELIELGDEPHVLTIAQDITERKRASEALQKSEALLAEAQRIGRIGHWEWVASSPDLLWSDETYRIYDIPNDGRPISRSLLTDRLDAEELERITRLDALIFSSHADMDYEFYIKLPEGGRRWLHQMAKVTYGADGSPQRMMGVVEDITERKVAELQIKELQDFTLATLDALSAHICVLDENGIIVSVNRAWREFAEANPPAPSDHYLYTNYLEVCDNVSGADAENAAAVAYGIRAVMKGEMDYFQMEYACHSPEIKRWFTVKVTRFNMQGPARVVITHENITERRLAEETLEKSERILRLFVEHSPASIAMFDLDMKYIVASQRYLLDYDLREQDLAGRSHDEVFPNIFAKWTETYRRCLQGFIEGPQEDPFYHADGRLDWLRWETRPWYDENGKIGGIILFSEVVTARKQAEDALRRSEEQYRYLFENNPHPMWAYDLKTLAFLAVNDAAVDKYGYSREEFLNMSILDIRPPEDIQRLLEDIATTRSVLQHSSGWRHKVKDGKIIDVEISSHTLNLTGHDAALVVAMDVTERRQAENKLRESEQKYRSLHDSMIDGFVSVAMDGSVLESNTIYRDMLGYSEDELTQLKYTDITPEKWQRYEAQIIETQILVRGYSDIYEKEYRRKDGSIFPVELHTVLMRDDDGQPKGMWAIVRDITDRKQVEEQIRRRANELEVLYENGLAIASLMDMHQIAEKVIEILARKLEWHHAVIRLYDPTEEKVNILAFNHAGLSKKERAAHLEKLNMKTQVRGKGMSGWVLEHGETVLANNVRLDPRYMATYPNIHSGLYVPLKLGDVTIGSISVESTRASAFKDEDKRLLETIASQASIAIENARLYLKVQQELIDRRQMQESLRQSERHLRAILQTTSDGFWILDTSGRFKDVNDAYCQMSGYSREEFLQLSIQDIEVNGNGGGLTGRIQKIMDEGKARFESRHRRKDGSVFDVEIGVNRMDEELICFGHDITNRKLTEQEIKLANERFSEIAENISDIFWIADPYTDKNIYVSPAFEPLIGMSFESVEKLPGGFKNLVLDEDRDILELAHQQEHEGLKTDVQYRIRRPDGSICWIRDKSTPVFDKDGKVVRVVGVAQDITSRKRVEIERQKLIDALSARTEELSLLLEAGHALSETLDQQQIYGIIHHYVKAGLPCDTLIVSSYEPKSGLITCEYLETEEGPQDVSGFPPIPIELPGRGTQSQVIHTGESMLLPDYMKALNTANTTYFFDKHGEIVDTTIEDEEERPRSAIIVPLKVDGKVAGVIQVFSNRLNSYNEDHLRFVETLTFHISAALSNTHLFAELEQRVQERTAEIETIRQRLQLATKAAELGVWDWNIKTGELLWDEQMSLNYGLDQGAFQGTLESFISFVHPEDVDMLMSFTQNAIEGNSPSQTHYRIIRGDGSTGYIKAHGIVLRDEAGQPQHVVGVTQNITQEKLAELALRESEEQNRLLFEEAPDAVILFDELGKVKRMNHAFEILTGVAGDRFAGHSMEEMGLVSRDQMERLETAAFQSIQMQNNFASTELKLISVDRNIRDLGMRIFALKIQGYQHYLTTMRDITAEKKAAEALRIANAEMERALRLKDEFLANMSHELRTPLNAILGISESLEEQVVGTLNLKQQHYIRTVSESGRHLLALINDILDLSKIEAGRMEINVREVSIETLVQSSLRMIKELAQKKNLNVSFNIDDQVQSVDADERRLKQVLVNLLSNAVKFTPDGGKIGLEVSGDSQEEQLTFTVWDSGIGIALEDIPRLFQPFVQLDSGLNREHSGTGLGLALVSEIIRLHGGRVGVQSLPGEGSRFFVVLPWKQDKVLSAVKLASANAPTQPLAPSIRANRGKILLVEDTDSVILFVNDYLQALGYKVFVANDGISGVAEAENQNPDMILMDIQMPGIDGFEATKRIRNIPSLKEIPIIALTAMAMPGDRERCLEAGMQDYLSKPISLKELAKMVHDYMQESRGKSR